jgi:hypothetical protein
MSWLYSRALVAAYSAENFSDGELSALSKSNPIPQAYCASDRMTVFSRLSRFGMTFAPLTESHGAELLTSYLADFPARTSAQREEAQESKASAPASGKNTPGLLAKYDRDSSSWKTVLSSLFEDLEPSSVIFPRWGMTRAGALFQQPTPERRTCGKEFGLLPTPSAMEYGSNRGGAAGRMGPVRPSLGTMARQGLWPTPTKSSGTGAGEHGTGGPNLQTAVKLWPTPRTAGMCGGTGNWNQLKEKCADLDEARKMGAGNGGQLNPTWVEWLMGWPLGWTDLKLLGTDKFRQWSESHGNT